MRQTALPHRRIARPLALALAASTAAPLLTGCVASDEYQNTAESARALEARNVELTQEVTSLRNALERREASDADLRAQNARLRQERAELASSIDRLRESVRQAEEGIANVRLSGLDPATDRALRRLASRYPDLMTYDPATGRVNFASDLTFPSGSDQVREGAQRGLADLARILSTTDGASYLIYVEGHTDAQVPSNPATLRNHPTNRHLSAHRAIAVGNVLKEQGVAATRIFTGGWGAARPAVPNTATGNTPANRRVEIYLVPDAGTTAQAPPAGGRNASAADAEPARDAPMK